MGGTPTLPEVPGVELGITSDGFFDLEQAPKTCTPTPTPTPTPTRTPTRTRTRTQTPTPNPNPGCNKAYVNQAGLNQHQLFKGHAPERHGHTIGRPEEPLDRCLGAGQKPPFTPVNREGTPNELPDGWVCTMHERSADEGMYTRYKGPHGERAQSLKQVWVRIRVRVRVSNPSPSPSPNPNPSPYPNSNPSPSPDPDPYPNNNPNPNPDPKQVWVLHAEATGRHTPVVVDLDDDLDVLPFGLAAGGGRTTHDRSEARSAEREARLLAERDVAARDDGDAEPEEAHHSSEQRQANGRCGARDTALHIEEVD